MPIYVNNSGTWTQAQEVYVNDSGTWKACNDVLVNDSGTWKSALYSAGSQDYTSAGSYSFTVPAGVYTLTATVVGGGGGGGGTDGNGDQHAGGSGGSGGKYVNQSISVTPGQVLSVTVGAGGLPGWCRFNGNFYFGPSGTSGSENGGTGGSSSFGGYTATGGGGGGGNHGDNGDGYAGSAGSPDGTPGINPDVYGDPRNNFNCTPGVTNGTGYGSSGRSNGAQGDPESGTSGAVLISW